jgi:2,3-bisphosphoglycerate-dependent phosphoglycerate mutase
MNEPAALWLVRHGQSEGNVVRAAAAADAEVLDIPDRDMDVPLSELGRRQAAAFGAWLHGRPPGQRPEVVVSSPYRRAADTAAELTRAAELGAEIVLDERLRERDLGMMDLLTTRGFAARFPEEAAHRTRLGKFYYRPPGGESWVDVALRCRSLLDSLSREYPGRRVLLVTHEVVIIMIRYVLEHLDERAALALSTDRAIANCSLTAYAADGDGRLHPEAVAWTAPLEDTGVPVTAEPDPTVASR